MQSTPTTKLSTWNDGYRDFLKGKLEKGDFECILKELLAVIHRDGGHYTLLAGLETSILEAFNLQYVMRDELRDLRAKLRASKG